MTQREHGVRGLAGEPLPSSGRPWQEALGLVLPGSEGHGQVPATLETGSSLVTVPPLCHPTWRPRTVPWALCGCPFATHQPVAWRAPFLPGSISCYRWDRKTPQGGAEEGACLAGKPWGHFLPLPVTRQALGRWLCPTTVRGATLARGPAFLGPTSPPGWPLRSTTRAEAHRASGRLLGPGFQGPGHLSLETPGWTLLPSRQQGWRAPRWQVLPLLCPHFPGGHLRCHHA